MAVLEYNAGGFGRTQPELVFFFRRREPGHSLFKYKRRNALATFCAIGNCDSNARVSVDCVGDEILGTVDYPTTVFAHRGRPCAGCVRSRARLGQSPRAQVFTRSKWNQIFLLLFLSSKLVDVI